MVLGRLLACKSLTDRTMQTYLVGTSCSWIGPLKKVARFFEAWEISSVVFEMESLLINSSRTLTDFWFSEATTEETISTAGAIMCLRSVWICCVVKRLLLTVSSERTENDKSEGKSSSVYVVGRTMQVRKRNTNNELPTLLCE